jgi:hypothetical protein
VYPSRTRKNQLKPIRNAGKSVGIWKKEEEEAQNFKSVVHSASASHDKCDAT